jgi:hypothetical protein
MRAISTAIEIILRDGAGILRTAVRILVRRSSFGRKGMLFDWQLDSMMIKARNNCY